MIERINKIFCISLLGSFKFWLGNVADCTTNEEMHKPLIQMKFDNINVLFNSGRGCFKHTNRSKQPNQIDEVITEGENRLFLEHPSPIINITIQYTINK